MKPKETALNFVRAINAHDIKAMEILLAPDHRFIDPHGRAFYEHEGLLDGWSAYFEWFPDYEIIIGETFEQNHVVAFFGMARGSYRGNEHCAWIIPAAWMAVVKANRIQEWHVFADTKLPLDSMS